MKRNSEKVYNNKSSNHSKWKNLETKVLKTSNSSHTYRAYVENKLFDLAKELERIALSDSYFVEKKLYPNVDFYSGIILKAMGFPISLFTVIFAVARTVGWVSHWNEMIEDPNQRIGRPRQLYTGPNKRNYVKLNKRG